MKRSKASQASVAFLGGAFLCLLLGAPLQAQKRSGSSQITNHSAAQEWQKFEALLSGIHGQSTSVPENFITPKYTSGALMGNGDIGVVAGDPLISQQSFWFGKSDFWVLQHESETQFAGTRVARYKRRQVISFNSAQRKQIGNNGAHENHKPTTGHVRPGNHPFSAVQLRATPLWQRCL